MERVLAGVAVAALLCGGALGQSASTAPVFEAVDVHLRAADPFMSGRSETYMSGGLIPGGRYELHRANMADLIQAAYSLQEYEVYGGPNWLETDHYEVIAKAPAGSTPADLKLMLKALLADRFELVVHNAKQEMDVVAFTVSRPGLLQPSEGEAQTGCKNTNEGGLLAVDCNHMTMADFVRSFGWAANAGIRPPLDLTGLKGQYDFTLKWSLPGPRPPGSPDADAGPQVTFAEAIDKQVGLKTVEQKYPVPVLVVDSVNHTPTPNAAGIEKILGVPVEFEAASVKPSQPGNPNRRFQVRRGRVEVENIPLKALIAISQNQFPIMAARETTSEWEMNFERDTILGGPKWIDSQSFDIVAKVDDAAYSPAWLPDQVMVMLRALLAERFKLVTHTEQRPVPVWVLSAAKGGLKFKAADPKSRSGCKYSGGQVGTGADAMPVQIYTCHNVTMSQLADSLHAMARAYVDRAAVDMTGLKGGYDLTLQFATIGTINARRAQTQGAAAGAVPQASDTAAGVTLYEALEKLGLKLESGRKAPQPVIVIDHVEPLTEDN